MEVKSMKKSGILVLMMVIMTLIIWAPIKVESAIGIDINPCTLPECVSACKKTLKAKYQSATCATGPKGKYCICLG
ncbi:hypothetical protein BC332_08721 [Capsicum chinense]|nr:hypothetical protein BC332_08721 [Capsicum chinense]